MSVLPRLRVLTAVVELNVINLAAGFDGWIYERGASAPGQIAGVIRVAAHFDSTSVTRFTGEVVPTCRTAQPRECYDLHTGVAGALGNRFFDSKAAWNKSRRRRRP